MTFALHQWSCIIFVEKKLRHVVHKVCDTISYWLWDVYCGYDHTKQLSYWVSMIGSSHRHTLSILLLCILLCFLVNEWIIIYLAIDGYMADPFFLNLKIGLCSSLEWLCWKRWAKISVDWKTKSSQIYLSRNAWYSSWWRIGL